MYADELKKVIHKAFLLLNVCI